MIDASIADVNRMRQQDLIAQETGTKELDAATRNIGATHMDLGAVAANKEYAPQNIPQYIWGQDIARDEIKNGIGAQVEKLNADLQKGINDLKSGKETWWTNDSLNHTASLLDERRHAYNDIQSQTWEERMADQQKPAVIDAKLQEERMKLASFQRQYGIQDQRASVNNAADAMVAELMAQKEAYAKAASEASDPVRAQSIASQIATSRGRNGRIQWQQRFYAFRRIATEQAGQLAQQETQKLESQRPQIQEAVQAFRERAASGRASGNVKEADSWDEYLNRIDAEPNVRKQIEMLAALDPKHPQVRALTEAADAHNLLGTFDETRLPKTSPEQGAADAIDKDVGIQIQKRATNDRAALGEVSKTVMEEGDQARRRGIDSMKVASQQIGEATTNLFKAARLAKVKSAQVLADAKEYTHAMSDMDKGAVHGYGKNGIETQERLQARLDRIRDPQNKTFHTIESYQQTMAGLSRENLLQAYRIGKIDKDSYNTLSSKYQNFIGKPLRPSFLKRSIISISLYISSN